MKSPVDSSTNLSAGPEERDLTVAMRRLHPQATLPARMSALAAGHDLYACLDVPVVLEAGGRALVATGWAMALPAGFEAQVRPRSGLAYRHGVTVLNAPGTIDADYRGELKVLLINHGTAPFEVRHGERIAQLVVAPVVAATWDIRESLDPATPDGGGRGEGGFGSTGQR